MGLFLVELVTCVRGICQQLDLEKGALRRSWTELNQSTTCYKTFIKMGAHIINIYIYHILLHILHYGEALQLPGSQTILKGPGHSADLSAKPLGVSQHRVR